MDLNFKWRTRAKQALADYFRRYSFPRLTLTLLLLLTGLAGFFLSAGLFRLGIVEMGFRYPLALIGSYVFFLAMLRIWVEIERRRFDHAAIQLERPVGTIDEEDEQPRRTSERSWIDWLDGLNFGDLSFDLDGEGCLAGMLVTILLGVALFLVGTILVTLVSTPLLLAEVFLDAFLVAALYRRLRVAARGYWLGTALRKTWRTVLIWAVVLGALGWALEALAPGNHTLSSALRELRKAHSSDRPKP